MPFLLCSFAAACVSVAPLYWDAFLIKYYVAASMSDVITADGSVSYDRLKQFIIEIIVLYACLSSFSADRYGT